MYYEHLIFSFSQVSTPLLLRANQSALSLSSSEEYQESTPFRRSKRTGLSPRERAVLNNNLRNSREEIKSNKYHPDNISKPHILETNLKEKRSRSKQKSDKSGKDRHANRKKKRKQTGDDRNTKDTSNPGVRETSFITPISRNGSTDYLINRTTTPRVNDNHRMVTPDTGRDSRMDGRYGHGLASTIGGSRGTFLETETISTVLDIEKFSESDC